MSSSDHAYRLLHVLLSNLIAILMLFYRLRNKRAKAAARADGAALDTAGSDSHAAPAIAVESGEPLPSQGAFGLSPFEKLKARVVALCKRSGALPRSSRCPQRAWKRRLSTSGLESLT